MNNQYLQGILFGFSTFLLYSLADACLKFLGQSPLPYTQSLFLLASLTTAFLALPTLAQGKPERLRTNKTKIVLLYGLIGTVGGGLNIIVFTTLPMTTVYIAYFTSPIITSLIGRFFLNEPLEPKRALLLLTSFAGTLFALNPFAANAPSAPTWVWFILPILPLTFSALFVFLRVLRESETPEALTVIPSAIRALCFLPFGLFMWHPISWGQALFILLAALCYAIGYRTLAYANKIAPTTLVSPTHYSQLIYGAVLGYIFWNDVPTWHTIAGSAVIVIAGIAAARLTRPQPQTA